MRAGGWGGGVCGEASGVVPPDARGHPLPSPVSRDQGPCPAVWWGYMCGSWRVPSPPPSWGLGLGVLICGLGPPRVPASWSVRGHPAGLGTARGSVMRGSSHLGGQWTGGASRDRPCVGGLPRGPLPQRPGVCCGRVLGLLQPLLASLSTHSGPPAPEQRGGWGA